MRKIFRYVTCAAIIIFACTLFFKNYNTVFAMQPVVVKDTVPGSKPAMEMVREKENEKNINPGKPNAPVQVIASGATNKQPAKKKRKCCFLCRKK